MADALPAAHLRDWPREFHTTRWSRVILAGSSSEDTAREALASLCRDYWRPLYHFARQKGHGPEDAEDLTQSFIARLVEKNSVASADRERGKFRTFLLSSFCHHMASHHRAASTQKRGGNQEIVSLDREVEEGFSLPANGETPEQQYERNWVLALLDRVTARLREEYTSAGRVQFFETLQPHLSGASSRPNYAALGATLGISESGIAVAVHRMRRRYGELLREEVASTVAEPGEVEEELRYLMRVIS